MILCNEWRGFAAREMSSALSCAACVPEFCLFAPERQREKKRPRTQINKSRKRWRCEQKSGLRRWMQALTFSIYSLLYIQGIQISPSCCGRRAAFCYLEQTRPKITVCSFNCQELVCWADWPTVFVKSIPAPRLVYFSLCLFQWRVQISSSVLSALSESVIQLLCGNQSRSRSVIM